MKKINSRFHIEGERIIKTSNGQPIPDDEPVIILRGRDRLVIPLLDYYRTLCVDDGCNDYFMGEVDDSIEQFRRFAAEHPERMKQPGVTRGK